ncbi:MAG TPA: DUF3775 domain-containing protein [Hyphomicrobiaceae bacterium]|nr:DUF3775 domain-containing protein [Hyphomicrobiaceae bacterium]
MPRTPEGQTEETPDLAISPEKVCFVIIKAREFSAKDIVTEPDTGSNASDDAMISVLEDHPDDPVVEELTSFISSLSEDEQIDLVTLAWLGREDNTMEDWPTLRAEAARAHSTRTTHTANYLLGTPLVADYLEEALSMFGLSCEEYESNRL